MSESNMQLSTIEVTQLTSILQDIVLHLIPKDDIRGYTATELSELWSIPVVKVHWLRDYGALKAIKKGREFMFPHREVVRFLDEYVGMDLSTREAIKLSVQIVNQRKRKEKAI